VRELMKFLKPRQGLIVRDPSSYIPLPAEGASVEWTGPTGRYYRRRVNCGDCIKAKAAQAKTENKKRRE